MGKQNANHLLLMASLLRILASAIMCHKKTGQDANARRKKNNALHCATDV